MYIKKVVVRGFCTYKDETELELSEKANVIVGLNGSGKSNILLAISFIMADMGLPSNDKKIFLHEGASTVVTTAYVEVTFGNTKKRFNMFNEDEVVIKRIFGSKRDDWLLNGKHIMKSELVQLLESAGFSRSNPYFIVRQGKISELTTMTDMMRLKLLKDVAGTKVYDAKREESLKYLNETEERRHRIEENIKTVQTKMEALMEEQKELKEFQQLEKLKRYVEYCINEIDWKNAFEMEKKSEVLLKASEEKLANMDREMFAVTTNIEIKQNALAQFDRAHKKLSRLKFDKQESLVNIHRSLRRVELEIKEMQDDELNGSAFAVNSKKDCSKLKAEVTKLGDKLKNSIRPNVAKLRNKYEAAATEYNNAEQTIAQLLAKQNRAEQFSSIEERNSALKKQAKELEAGLSKKQTELKKQSKMIKDAKEDIAIVMKEISNLDELSSTYDDRMETENQKHSLLSQRIVTLTEERRKLQYQQSESAKANEKAVSSYNEVEEKYWRSMRGTIRRGVKCTEEFNLNGISGKLYGLVIDNVKVPEEYRTAVEVVGGTQLLNFIVSDATTATALVEHLKQTTSAALTISPLKEIKAKASFRSDFPNNDDRVLPLIKCIQFDEVLSPIIHQIWGQTLLVKDSETASEYRSLQWDCVTPDGDLYSRKGLVSGGFMRDSQSRLFLHSEMKRYEGILQKQRDSMEMIEKDTRRVEEEIREARESLVSCSNNKLELSAEHEEQVNKAFERNNTLLQLNDKLENLEKMKMVDTDDCEDMKNQIQTIRREILTPKLGVLTDAEKSTLEELEGERKRRKQVMDAADAALLESENTLLTFEGDLKKKQQRLQQVEMATSNSKHVEASDTLESSMHEDREYRMKLDELKSDCEALDQQISDVKKQLESASTELEEAMTQEKQMKKEMSAVSLEAEKRKQDVETFRNEKEEASGKRFTLPSMTAEFEKYQKMSRAALTKEHSRLLGKSSVYKQINRKPVDQLSIFIDEHETLLRRKEEINDSFKSIVKLIEDFDDAKEKTLMGTFQKINTQFGVIFGELIPNGTAKLVLKRLSAEQLESATRKQLSDLHLNTDNTNNMSEGEIKTAASSKIASIVGIGIKVSFSGAEQTFYGMHQLSGGQKTVVALALTFAIQRCDPAPFYLFDEIDAALDDQYRAAVADMIRKQSGMDAQFLITTFRPEFVTLADKCFKVTIRNRASAITPISKEEAVYILEEKLAIEDVQ